jgi:hypothetical protein
MNRFAAADQFDSDEDVPKQMNKTQVKKEERKITEKPVKVKVNAAKMEEGGFEVTQKARNPAPARGGAGAARGSDRPRGRGGNRGGRGGARPVRRDDEGNLVGAGSNNRERKPFTGKAREEGHPYDRKDGTGRGRRPVKKDGHGKGNVGDDQAMNYKRKGTDAEAEEKATGEEEAKVAEPKVEEPKVIIKEEIIGVSMDDFFQGRSGKGKVQGRAAEGVKDAKVSANDAEKVKQSTLQQNSYMKSTVAKTSDLSTAKIVGFGNVADDEPVQERRGGDRRGDKPQRGGDKPQRGGRRQNPKAALKKTDEEFPSL